MKQEEQEDIMTDEEATPLHWFLLEVFSQQIFGKTHQIEKPEEQNPLKKVA